MQDRPTAIELLQSAQEFCERDLIPNLNGRVAFHARVLRNVLSILEREWELEEDAIRAEHARLRNLLDLKETPPTLAALRAAVSDANTELSDEIRSGHMDDRLDEIAAVLAETVREKLAIANPRYAE